MATKRSRRTGPLGGRALGPLAGRPVRPLAGRPVMITGAASGIGRSLARRLSGLGSPAAIADIDEAGLK
jgi:FlaA1/EpsC-like NDP-sugar epimerase